jgi:hypothetical protein
MKSIVSFSLAALAAGSLAFMTPAPAQAQAKTAPGTTISNTATASYKDSSGNTYNTNSNTVSVLVQNAPILTITPSAGATVPPGSSVTDTYTLTNGGNNSGTFNVSGIPFGGTGNTANPVTGTVTYTVTLPGGSPVTFTALSGGTGPTASVNNYLAANSVAAAAAVTLTVTYTVPQTAVSGNTYTTTPTATITYAAGGTGSGAYPAVTSAPVSATVTNTVAADALLNLQKFGTTNAGTGNIDYVVNAANSGAFAAKDLQSVATLLGQPNKGVLITDKLPVFGGAPLQVAGNVVVTTQAAKGYLNGTIAILYTTNATGASGWTLSGTAAAGTATSGTIPAGATFIGVYLYNGTGGAEVGPSTGSSAGNVSNANAAISIAFSVKQPTGTGSGNPAAVSNIANSLIGDNAATEHVIAPGVPSGSLADGTGNTGTLTGGTVAVANTTPIAAPSGASNIVQNGASATQTVLNGPFSAPGATGSYDGVVAVNNNNDFTAAVFSSGILATNTSTTAGSPTGNAIGAVQTINVPNSVQNSGNKDDTFTLTATAPAGWTVQLFTYNGGAPGTALGESTAGATSTATGLAIASGATLNYFAVYTAPATALTLARFDAVIQAQGTATGSGQAADTNTTHNELYSGIVALTKSVTIVSSGCPAGTTSPGPVSTLPGVCPGGTVQFKVDYRSIAVGPGAGNTEPAAAIAPLSITAGSLTIVDDGTGNTVVTPGNNWYTYTNGLGGAPTDTTAGTVFTYYTSTGTVTVTPAGAAKFSAQVGGAAFVLGPTASGQITFQVTVK